MANAEELAKYVAATSSELINEDIAKGKNSRVPPPPEPGKYIVCQNCGKVMLPQDFSKDKNERRKEFKWQMHIACINSLLDECDRMTPGLMSERTKDPLNSARRLS
jgi:hypothetical protein